MGWPTCYIIFTLGRFFDGFGLPLRRCSVSASHHAFMQARRREFGMECETGPGRMISTMRYMSGYDYDTSLGKRDVGARTRAGWLSVLPSSCIECCLDGMF